MRGNFCRVSVMAAVMVTSVALSVSPAFGHGENDARPLARGEAVGPYNVSVWQVIGDHGSDLPSHMILTFGDVAPADSDAVTIVTSPAHRKLDGRRLESGAWETTGTVAFGDTFTVEIETSEATWTSTPLIVPEPPSSRLPMRPLMSLAVFATTAMVMWLGRRTKRVWSSPPAVSTRATT